MEESGLTLVCLASGRGVDLWQPSFPIYPPSLGNGAGKKFMSASWALEKSSPEMLLEPCLPPSLLPGLLALSRVPSPP